MKAHFLKLARTKLAIIAILALTTTFVAGTPVHATETSLGPLYGFAQTPTITLEDCAQTYQITSRYTAECLVKKWNQEPAFLLQFDTQVAQWKYDSGLRWRLTVTFQKIANGYLAQIEGDVNMPKERLGFKTAKKYLRSAIEETRKNQFTQRIMRLGKTSSDAGEEALGQMYQVTRTVTLSSDALIKACVKNLRGTAAKKSCILHFATYNAGEIVVNRAELQATSTNKSRSLSLAVTASPGWRGYGSYSLGYMRVDFSGSYSAKSFKALFLDAVKKSKRKTFDFEIQKIGAPAVKSSTFRERSAQALSLIQRDIRIDLEKCKPLWKKISDGYGACEVPLYDAPVIIGNQVTFLSANTSGRFGPALVIVKPSRQGFLLEIFGDSRVVENFANADVYLKSALQNAGRDTFITYSLR